MFRGPSQKELAAMRAVADKAYESTIVGNTRKDFISFSTISPESGRYYFEYKDGVTVVVSPFKAGSYQASVRGPDGKVIKRPKRDEVF